MLDIHFFPRIYTPCSGRVPLYQVCTHACTHRYFKKVSRFATKTVAHAAKRGAELQSVTKYVGTLGIFNVYSTFTFFFARQMLSPQPPSPFNVGSDKRDTPNPKQRVYKVWNIDEGEGYIIKFAV